MVKGQLRARGIGDERVLAAMAAVPREEFVPEDLRSRAYSDAALPIGSGQTISQPWIVAAMCAALELSGTERVLEVGTGSGYSAAVLAHLCSEVVSLERIGTLAASARRRLEGSGDAHAERVSVAVGDGSLGYPLAAPYDAIAVNAAAPGPPLTLLEQLGSEGRLIAPVLAGRDETLTLFRRAEAEAAAFTQTRIAGCRFVPLIGAEGQSDR